MTDQVQVEHGAWPWQPSDDAEVVEEYDRYDVPLEGLMRQGGYTYLFRCLAGRDEAASLWVYARVEESDRERLAEAEGVEYDAAALTILTSRPISAALASDAGGISVSVELDASDAHSYSDVFKAVMAAVDRELEYLDRAHQERQDLGLVSAF